MNLIALRFTSNDTLQIVKKHLPIKHLTLLLSRNHGFAHTCCIDACVCTGAAYLSYMNFIRFMPPQRCAEGPFFADCGGIRFTQLSN